MRTLFDWLWTLFGYRVVQPRSDAHAYHMRRHAQERALQRRARNPAARRAHRELAMAHRRAMQAAGRMETNAAPMAGASDRVRSLSAREVLTIGDTDVGTLH